MKHKTDYLTIKEIDSMLQYCFDKNNIRDYLLILTLYRTARRITEIVGEKPYTRKIGLRPCDIHPDGLIEFDILKKNPIKSKNKKGELKNPEKVLKARIKKMPKRALKPVDDYFLEVLNSYIESEGIRKRDRIFPITRQRADFIIKKVAKACNIVRPKNKIHAHNFRHSLAIHLLKNNPNDASILKQVQELLDHSSIVITMHYAQFTQYDKKKSLNKLFDNT